jgi:hypothetical protein
MNFGMLRYSLQSPPWHLLNALWPLVPLFGSVMLYLTPRHHRVWGSLILACGIASWVLLGSFLADIAGILAIRWSPSATNSLGLKQLNKSY